MYNNLKQGKNKNKINSLNENDFYSGEGNQKIKELLEIFSQREKNYKLDNKLQALIKSAFTPIIKQRLEPGQLLSKNLGNIYTGSLYVGLISLILDPKVDLSNKRVFMFSYGSGCAASIFTLKFNSNSYLKMRETNSDVMKNLTNRIKKMPEELEKILLRKEKLYLSPNYEPTDDISQLFDGTYYIEKVDDQWRRIYVRKGDKERRISYNKLSNFNNMQEDLEKMDSSQRRLNLIKSQLIASDKGQISSTSHVLPRKISIEDNNMWSGFHKKSIYERQLQIKKVYPEVDVENLKSGGLTLMRADNMIENCIGIISLPIGLCPNLTVNSKKYNVPMAVEEPSVIAAVSNAAKLITENNGFFCFSDPSLMITQIHFVDTNTEETEKYINDHKSKLISVANGFCQDMVQRGGGVKDLYTRILTPGQNQDGRIVIEAIVDVRESMGANTLSTIAEGLAYYIQPNIKGLPILKILTNLAIYRKSTAEFKINIENLSYKGIQGEEVARRIVEAYEIAARDPFRCATHNKGIMNGIDAIALALGQDWRALEAGAHSFASINMKTLNTDGYRPLTYYKIVELNGEKYLNGFLTIPICIGVVGGAINSNANYQNMFKLLGNPSSKELAHIMVSIGLAQNFAALRALVSEGIQKGHMGLHARNFAIKAGVPDYLIPDVVNFMKNNKIISVNAAKNYLDSFNVYSEMRGSIKNENGVAKDLSSFYIEIDYSFLKEPIVMNFLLNTKINPPVHFALRSRKIKDDDNRVSEIFKVLFGQQKHEDWLHEFIKFVNHFDFFNKNANLSSLYSLKYKIKMIVILLYTVSYNLLQFNFDETKNFLHKMLNHENNYDKMLELLSSVPNSIALNFGLSVILELYEIMKFYFNNYVKTNKMITDKIISEVENSLKGFVNMFELCESIKQGKEKLDEKTFRSFLELRLKRLNATVMILSDLAFAEENISEEILNYFLALGKYVEIKITLIRDCHRYKENERKFTNSYMLFNELSKLKGIDNPSIVESSYFNLMKEERTKLKDEALNLGKIYKDFFSLVKIFEADLENHYKSKVDNKTSQNINPKF